MTALLRRSTPWLLLTPALLLVLVFIVLPYAITFYYSTTNATLGHLTGVESVGLANYDKVLTSHAPPFPSVVFITVLFTAGTLVGSLVVGTGLALVLQTVGSTTRAVLLGVFLIPWVIAAVVIGYAWRLMYDPQIGLGNTLLGMVGLGPVSWLTDRTTSIASLIVANIWASYGIVLLIMSGALANLPQNLIFAAQIDGASYARVVRRIVLPSVRPAFLLAGLVALVSGLNVFDLVYVMTGGGPVYQTETLALEMFRITTRRGAVGQGAAITVMLFSISLALAVAYVVIWRREARRWT